MQSFRTLSKVLMFPPVITLLYDLVDGWFVKNNVKIDSLEVWTRAVGGQETLDFIMPVFKTVLSSGGARAFFGAPACVSLLAFPVIFYTIYFFWFRISGGKGSGKFKYKSHD